MVGYHFFCCFHFGLPTPVQTISNDDEFNKPFPPGLWPFFSFSNLAIRKDPLPFSVRFFPYFSSFFLLNFP